MSEDKIVQAVCERGYICTDLSDKSALYVPEDLWDENDHSEGECAVLVQDATEHEWLDKNYQLYSVPEFPPIQAVIDQVKGAKLLNSVNSGDSGGTIFLGY